MSVIHPIHPVQPETPECHSCPICRSNLLGQIDQRQDGHLDTHCLQMEYAPGAQIYRQGQTGVNLYSVCRGLIKLDQRLPDGEPRTVRLLQPGCVFGLELLSHHQYQHSASSIGRSRICRIPAHLVNQLAQADPALHQSLMQQWQLALDEADFVIAQLSTGPARQRVARLLLHLASPANGADVCTAPPRDDMASLLGLTPETVSRTTASFKREGWLREQGGIFTLDHERLLAISQGNEIDPPERAAPSSA